MIRVKRGDKVQVRSGKYRGKQGEVMKVLPPRSKRLREIGEARSMRKQVMRSEWRVIVDGVNVAKRNTKPRGQTMQGGIIDKDMPIPMSAVSIVCPACGPVRPAVLFDEQGRKLRVCNKCTTDLG